MTRRAKFGTVTTGLSLSGNEKPWDSPMHGKGRVQAQAQCHDPRVRLRFSQTFHSWRTCWISGYVRDTLSEDASWEPGPGLSGPMPHGIP